MYDTDTALIDTDTAVTETDTDTVVTETNTDTVVTETDTDTVVTETDTDTVVTKTDTDTVVTETNTDTVVESSDKTIYGTSSDDLINISQSGSVRSLAGNDTINVKSKDVFAYGGSGDDLFVVDAYSYGNLTDITISGGEGNDTIQFRPDTYGYDNLGIVISDFSNNDVLRFDGSDYYYSDYYSSYRKLTQSVIGGNVVISDNASIDSYYGTSERITPKFSITLQGVSDISQVANAKYYRYNGSTPRDYKTFAELFGVSAASTNTTPAETVKPEPVVTVTEDDDDTTTTTSTTTTEEVTTTTTKTTTTTEEVATTTKTTTTTTKDTLPTATGSDDDSTADDSTKSSGGNTVINNINNYYGDYTDNSNNNGTIVQGSTVNGNVTNNTTVDNSKTIIISGNTYTYDGGDKVIENYKQGEVVELASDYAGIDLKENSFYVKSSSGSLEIQNSRDKFVGYSAQSEMVAYSYVAGSSGAVDGRNYDKAEIMIGADNANNQIYAGNAGSSLWGGNGGTDTLTGGNGYDEFFYAVGGGDDVIQNANDNDLINLASVTLSQISSVEVNIGQVNINFVDGGNLQVQGGSGVGYQIAEGTFQVNHSTGHWSNK